MIEDNDGETYVTLKEEEFVLPQLSLTEEDSQGTPSCGNYLCSNRILTVLAESDDLDSTISKKPGRKPMPDEDDLSDVNTIPYLYINSFLIFCIL